MTPARFPLRTQLTILLLALLCLVLMATSLAATVVLRGYLVDRVDAQLATAVREPAGQMPPGPRRGRLESAPSGVVLVRYDPAGQRVRQEGLAADDASGPDLAGWPARSTGTATVDAVDGSQRWRVLSRRGVGGATVLAAAPLEDVDDTVTRLLRINALVGVLALALGGVLAWLAVRRSLRPLRQVEGTAEAIASGDLTRRLPPADPRTEVGSLSASFNSMVDRFESAYSAQQHSETEARASEERMRRFVADASHELRTPLTSIRGFAELFRQGAVEPEQTGRVLRRIEDEAARMGLLVEDLLLLARLDQQRPLKRTPVDVLAVATDVVHDAATLHAQHVVRLGPTTGSELPVVLGDDARLRQVLGNLVTNAVTHTGAGTTVEVSVAALPGSVVVEVADDGEGMPPEVAARVFERFYRADESRARSVSSTSGSGLGLAIVAALVAAHEGTVTIDSEPGRGTTVTVALPAPSPEAASA
ncbi:MAG: sensor histidine kinase [Frankiales bacterium]|nr:sensor histidine kinase [Frankiales bacterium]